jgi:hypothetical protein
MGSEKVREMTGPVLDPGVGVVGVTLMPSSRSAALVVVLLMLNVQVSPIWRLRCAI